MAVAPTGAIYKALEFDGVSSRTYGVYITGEAVYNAPERDVKMITIPGRSGSFALDNGRFENITVTYPAGIFAETEADFREAISGFRNFLCSRKGYVRLKDEYNPNEYRMAVYKSGLEVEPAMLKAGEFEITFDCKPQRWLTSGETKQTIATSGDTITNPTLFESGPLLEVDGYGTIEFNGYEINIEDEVVGPLKLSDVKTNSNWQNLYFFANIVYDSSNLALMETGDNITLPAGSIFYTGFYLLEGTTLNSMSISITSSDFLCHISGNGDISRGKVFFITLDEDITVTKGTTSTLNINISGTGQYTYYGTTTNYSGTSTLQFNFNEDGFKTSKTAWTPTLPNRMYSISNCYYSVNSFTGYSTKSIAGHPIYIDCDLGEAYKIEGGQYASLNAFIDLGSILPTLAPGSNAITFDNTITDLKVVPRWWKV